MRNASAQLLSFGVGIHQKAFGGWVLPELAGGAYSAPPDHLAGSMEKGRKERKRERESLFSI